ncbi:hypothetical protein GCM10027615_77610 [Plantactinospora veratri]
MAFTGANVAIVVGLVLLLARWARAGPWLAAVLCGTALVGFVILARPSPSVVRAGTMGAIGLLALAVGRPRAALPALASAVTVLVLVDPELAGDPGFALSVLATGGLLLLAPGGGTGCGVVAYRRVRRRRWPSRRRHNWPAHRWWPDSPAPSAWWPYRRTSSRCRRWHRPLCSG